LADLPAPLPDSLVGQHNAPLGKQLLHIAIAQREPALQPDGIADDLTPVRARVFFRSIADRHAPNALRVERTAHLLFAPRDLS